MSATSTPVYSTRVSADVAAEQQRKATAEGMRELAQAMANSNSRNVIPVSDSETDSVFGSDSDSGSSDLVGRKRSRKSASKPRIIQADTAAIGKLNDRIRFLQLDLGNAMVDVEDAKTKAEGFSNQLAPYQRVNDELVFFKSAMTRAFKDVGSFTKAQLENRFKLFVEEASEHAKHCSIAIEKIGLDEVKAGMNRVLTAERKRFAQIEKSYKFRIFVVGAKELMLLICYWMTVLVVLVAIVYKLIY